MVVAVKGLFSRVEARYARVGAAPDASRTVLLDGENLFVVSVFDGMIHLETFWSVDILHIGQSLRSGHPYTLLAVGQQLADTPSAISDVTHHPAIYSPYVLRCGVEHQ